LSAFHDNCGKFRRFRGVPRLVIRYLACCALAMILLPAIGTGRASAQVYLPPLGGPGGGQFQAPCPSAQSLSGFELKVGDDVDAIRPLCVKVYGPNIIEGPVEGSWNGGGGGPHVVRLFCPPMKPVVLGISVGAEGEKTIIVNNVHLFCGLATATNQALEAYPSAIFDGPGYTPSPGFFGFTPGTSNHHYSSQRCPPGTVAIGVHGRSGVWLDAMGLICDAPWIIPMPATRGCRMPGEGFGLAPLCPTGTALGTVPTKKPAPTDAASICAAARSARAHKSPAADSLEQQCLKHPEGRTLGRVQTAGGSGPPSSICDAARSARDRGSPAAPGLAKQCEALGETVDPPLPPLGDFEATGATVTDGNLLASALRQRQSAGNRRGFNIGVGAAAGQTAWGNQLQRIGDALTPGEKEAFMVAISFALDWNRNANLAAVGARIAEANDQVSPARSANPDPRFALGFDIASGLYGAPALGAAGNSAMGPGAQAIRNGLGAIAQKGFDEGVRHYGIH
jgi:hypothetical protein